MQLYVTGTNDAAGVFQGDQHLGSASGTITLAFSVTYWTKLIHYPRIEPKFNKYVQMFTDTDSRD